MNSKMAEWDSAAVVEARSVADASMFRQSNVFSDTWFLRQLQLIDVAAECASHSKHGLVAAIKWVFRGTLLPSENKWRMWPFPE